MSKANKTTSTVRNIRLKSKVEEKEQQKLTKPLKSTVPAKLVTKRENASKQEEEKTKSLQKVMKPSMSTGTRQSKIANEVQGQGKVVSKKRAEVRNQPLLAKHTSETVKKMKNTVSQSVNKSRVMNTVHNVTVASPPPKRRDVQDVSPLGKNIIRERTRTRTLEPEEILVLKNSTSGPKSLDTFLTRKVKHLQEPTPVSNVIAKVKNPVAFEIQFDEKTKTKNNSREFNKETESKPEHEGSVEGEYEDDFESYESDFETGSSTADETSETSSSNEDAVSKSSKAHSQSETDESEETQPPITVIHRDKEDERKLDSGSYDLNSKKEKNPQVPLDSIDTLTVNSDQLDSGFSYGVFGSHSARSSASPPKPFRISKRAKELQDKIQLDTVSFILFEMKPVKYEHYMKIYGNCNTTQTSTQTNEDRLETETQTDELQCRSVWTQHPPHYNIHLIRENTFINLKNSCGEFLDKSEDSKDVSENLDPLTRSIQALSRFQRDEVKSVLEMQKQIDFDRLNGFLTRSVLTISAILSKSENSKWTKISRSAISTGFYTLNTKFLSALKVTRIFSSPKHNLVLAVHESVDEIYKSDFLNLISVWSTNETETPIRLLSTWSEVCRIDVCSETSDVIVAGLQDGSIAMWDLRETYSFCSKLDGYLKHFAASQTIAPSFNGDDLSSTDIGAVVDIKSFKITRQVQSFRMYKPIQFVSLNDTGVITIWSLVEIGRNNNTFSNFENSKNSTAEYSSPWARVKLTQSAICDLKDYLELKHIRINSKYDKTRSYFENDIFNDAVLKELQDSRDDFRLGLQGLRFTNLATGCERIFVAMNRNYIVSCSKTLKANRFMKLFIDESKFLFPTAIKLLNTEDFLIVGLSNGSVIALNCNQNKPEDGSKEFADPREEQQRQGESSSKLEFDSEIGKSCAIQNIIRNERRSFEYPETVELFDADKDPLLESNFLDGHQEALIYDQQILFDGSVLRKNLVQNIESSTDGRKLYALADGNLRVFDFFLGKELPGTLSGSARGFGLVKETSGFQDLVLLTTEEEVQVHKLK